MFTIITCLFTLAFSSEELVIDLNGLGRLRGSSGLLSRNGQHYHQFLGVPFAEPPVGELRFREPVPVTAWDDIRDATVPGPSCMQASYLPITGAEDCLTLSVFTKDPGARRPVLVYLHGGAFIHGGIAGKTGEYLLEEDIVLVTVQYRLGPLGWLTTADGEAPGNYGLQDQLLALRWVQQHIGAFGGEKDIVTLAGFSAGAASVNLLMLSPLSAGLFHRAVAMSGSALAWWASLNNLETTSKKLARAVNCTDTPSAAMISCLQNVSAADLMQAQSKFYPRMHEPMTVWSPRLDPEAEQRSVVPLEPAIAMVEGRSQPVPLLVGVAQSEGVWHAANYLTQDEVMTKFLDEFDEEAQTALGLRHYIKSEDMKEALKTIKSFYLGTLHRDTDFQKMLNNFVNGMIEMFGDAIFNFPIDSMIKFQSGQAHSPVWVYQYNYKHNHSLAFMDPKNPGQLRKPGFKQLEQPTHGHECSMLFPEFGGVIGPLSEEETKYSRKFVRFLVNFMKTGQPKLSNREEFKYWKPVIEESPSHYDHSETASIKQNLPFQSRMKFWGTLPILWRKRLYDYMTDKFQNLRENGDL